MCWSWKAQFLITERADEEKPVSKLWNAKARSEQNVSGTPVSKRLESAEYAF
jgi:hypothetical protein